jgi:acylphosphatase
MEKRVHAIYSGSVQGVGFRFACERAASSSGLNGWVRNMDDGRVEIVCEGREADIKEFLEKIYSIFNTSIRDIDVRWADATGEFGSFDIRFD